MRPVDDVFGMRVGHGTGARSLPVPGMRLARQLLRRSLLTVDAQARVPLVAGPDALDGVQGL